MGIKRDLGLRGASKLTDQKILWFPRHASRCTKAIAVLVLVAGCATAGPPGSQARANKPAHIASLTLDSGVKILLAPEEPEPVRRAAQDLARDFDKVMGRKPSIVTDPDQAGPERIWIAERSKLPDNIRPSGLTAPESFSISIVQSHGTPPRPAREVLLAGADMRGTMYAIYQFSQQFLGVDPLYYWTDQQPARRRAVTMPDDFTETQGPVFHYRGFFINDEDLLTGWAPGTKDGTGISLAVWNKIYETILRLKGNMVCPGTWIFPDEPQIKLAGQRGLIITQHHAIPLGLNVARWPEGVPYDYTTHPEILERAWRDAVKEYPPGVEVLWTVGLRGLSDVSYGSMDPSVRGNDKALGRLISRAIADQIQIVRAVHPNAQFITNLWQEGARLVHQGDLVIPPEVETVWADAGYGYPQDNGDLHAGQGIYYHVAMMNGRANQLTEMVPVSRVFSQLERYIKAGATNYLLLNTSDIRPVPLGIKAVMDVAWSGAPEGGGAATGQFIEQWSAEEFGPRAAAKVAKVYEDYFNAPAQFGIPRREYGDQLYHTEARWMMLAYMIDSPLYSLPSQSPKWEPPRIFSYRFGPRFANPKAFLSRGVAQEIKQCGDAEPRWDAVWKEALAAEPLVEPARLPFYQFHVLATIAINRESNRMLLEISKAVQEAQSGHLAEARASAGDALSTLDEIQAVEKAAEYGKWKNWYRGDWLTGVYRTQQMAEILSKFLSDPLTHLPAPVLWDGWEAYYHIMHYEGGRSADVN